MRCKKIQELLKSDYLDEEAGPRETRDVEEHLARCPQCRELEKELSQQRFIFSNSKRQEPPERVWENIREAIDAERLNQDEWAKESVFERLRNLKPVFPRPVFAFASIFAVVIVAVFFAVVVMNNRAYYRDNGAETFADYRINGENVDVASDFGTNVEKYFL
ncbi:MAG: zf-HC2 domain-containing protein [Candidatus Omnitrophota bacterium]